MTEYYFLHVHVSYHVLLACYFIVCLDSSLENMMVNLRAVHKKTDSHAAHEVLLACFLQSCNTQRWISCSARNIARLFYTKVNSSVVCEFELSHSTKIEHTCVPAHECQLRRELYHRLNRYTCGSHLSYSLSFIYCVVHCSCYTVRCTCIIWC